MDIVVGIGFDYPVFENSSHGSSLSSGLTSEYDHIYLNHHNDSKENKKEISLIDNKMIEIISFT